jgi:hypothetical protein
LSRSLRLSEARTERIARTGCPIDPRQEDAQDKEPAFRADYGSATAGDKHNEKSQHKNQRCPYPDLFVRRPDQKCAHKAAKGCYQHGAIMVECLFQDTLKLCWPNDIHIPPSQLQSHKGQRTDHDAADFVDLTAVLD